MNIETAIQKASLYLKRNNIKTSLLDSEILMTQVLKKDRKFLILNSNNEDECHKVLDIINKPVKYNKKAKIKWIATDQGIFDLNTVKPPNAP